MIGVENINQGGKTMSDVFDPGKSARRRARKAAARQEELIAKQKQKEAARLAESESEVAKRRALIQRKGGRSLLIATSPRGVEQLGG